MTSFSSYTFAATGAPTTRSLPTRLSESVNVKDWGAVGDGVSNDSTAINAAINYLLTNGGGGRVFFPPGTYYLGNPATPIDVAPSRGVYTVALIGSGRDATIITGTANNPNVYPPIGFFDNGTGSVGHTLPVAGLIVSSFGNTNPDAIVNFPQFSIILKDMTIHNSSTNKWSCAAQFNPCQAGSLVQNCKFIGNCGLAMAGFGGTVVHCSAVSSSTVPAANSYTSPDTTGTAIFTLPATGGTTRVWDGSVGISHSQGPVVGCDATGFDAGFIMGTISKFFGGNSASRCGVGIDCVDTWSWVGPYNGGKGLVSGNRFDRCIQAVLGGNFDVNGNVISGTEGPTTAASISNVTTNGTTVTVTTTVPHNISTGRKIILSSGLSGWFPTGNTTGIVTVTTGGGLTTSQFTFASTNSSGVTTGTWNYPIQYAIIGGSGQRTIAANTLSAVCSEASVSFGSQGGTTDEISVAMAMEGAYGWLPINGDNRTRNSWQYEMCGTTGTNNNPVLPFLLFAALPPNAAPTRLLVEGQQFWITDGKKKGGGTAALGDIIAGGGAQKIGVRYDGMNWIRCA